MAITDIEGNPIDQSGATYDNAAGGFITGSLATTPSTSAVDSSSDGTTLEHLGTFFSQLGTSVASVVNAVNKPQPVQIPRSNIPFSSANLGVAGSSSSILTLLLLGVLVFFGFRAFAKRA